MTTSGWVGVDFDGTLAEYHGIDAERSLGAPVPAMLERVKAWLTAGMTVKIVTARAAVSADVARIHDWCKEHGLPRLEVTDRKDFSMIELWDDRAVRVERNTGRVMSWGKTD